MDAAHGAAGAAGMGLSAASAAIALDLCPRAPPFLAALVTAEGAHVILVCPCFDPRDSFRPALQIPELCLGVFDLRRVQVFKGIEKTAKVVV